METEGVMPWYEVHLEAAVGDCWQCGNTVVECHRGCAPFCPGCVGSYETKHCEWCSEPLLDPEDYPEALGEENE